LTRLVTTIIAQPAVRQGTLSLLDQAVVSGTSFATSVIIGRMCANSKAALGIYALALSVVLLVRGIQTQVVSVPYQIYCHRHPGSARPSYLGSMMVHTLVVSALAIVGMLIWAAALASGMGPAKLAPVVWVLMGAMPLLLLRECIRYFTFAHLQFALAVAIDVTVAVVQLGGMLLLGLLGRLSPAAVYLVMGAACGAAFVGWLIAGHTPFRFVPGQIVADWWQNWRLGGWALASFLLGCTTPLILPWILCNAHGEAATGVLAACMLVVGIANMFVLGLGNFLMPKAAMAFHRGGTKECCRVLWASAAIYAVVVGSFCLLLALTGDRLAILLFSSKYAGTGPILLVLALGVLANTVGMTAGNGLWAIDRPHANFAADVCVLGITLLLAFRLVYPLAVIGIAIAALTGTVVGSLVRCMTLLWCMRSISHEGVASDHEVP
jgi:O-antigen/teichoic acid export membrane protein